MAEGTEPERRASDRRRGSRRQTERRQAGTPAQEQALAELILWVAHSATRKYVSIRPTTRWDYDTILGDALVGACEAALRWDGRGEQRAWLYVRAYGEVLDGVRDRSLLSRAMAKQCTDPEMVPQRYRTPLSLDTEDEQVLTFHEHHGALDPGYEAADLRGLLDSAFILLSDIERRVVMGSMYEGRPLRELGVELGLTESRICQIRIKALATMREHLEKELVET